MIGDQKAKGLETWVIFVAILISLGFCYSEKAPNYTFVRDATQAPAISYYDYIIVGGGTAGCPLAATLSEGSTRFVSEDGVINARARVLGGGSCLNAGFYTRASDAYVREAAWRPALVREAYRWVERKVAQRPAIRQWQSALRDGLVQAGVAPYNGFTYDHVYGTKVGGTIFDADGNRRSAADLLEYAHPERLTVLLHATVAKIRFELRGKARPTAHGVVFRDSAGKKHRAYLNKGSKNEIIVSAGAIGSPQVLMLSGVGPRGQLESLGINVVVDQPMVGVGMSDNPMNAVFVPSPTLVEVSLIQVVGITQFGSFIEGASGSDFDTAAPNSQLPRSRNFGMFSPQTGQLSIVPPKQRTPEAIAKAVEAMNSLADSYFQGGFILEKIIGPLSTGHLELRSRNPDANPAVTFNYFQEPEDIRRCVDGIRTIERVVASDAFAKFTYAYLPEAGLLNISKDFPVNLLPKHQNDSRSLEQYCKDTVMTIWHYHGGCRVGGVVDADYRVFGADALRVVDSSTFIYSPGTNPQATVMMLGR
uniref:Glucose-methanol-choline oxidoreductase N-terminal domain-containing protein n=1 Tax=Ananas comosus var. bracteatus TaxID=296719 RepID=A0A6V7PXK5_ANACO|nr:unnamed protein product [Ananas comosus var. bracteatus]